MDYKHEENEGQAKKRQQLNRKQIRRKEIQIEIFFYLLHLFIYLHIIVLLLLLLFLLSSDFKPTRTTSFHCRIETARAVFLAFTCSYCGCYISYLFLLLFLLL